MTTYVSLKAFESPEFQNSLHKVGKGSDQTMIYGWAHCCYYVMKDFTERAIAQKSSPIKKIYSYGVGKPNVSDQDVGKVTTLEGRRMNLLKSKTSLDVLKNTYRECKTAITNVVLENYKRQQEGLPLIPIVFAIDITKNPRPTNVQNICSKYYKLNKQITHKEIRRAYKLCSHPNPKIRAIACQTFKFVKVCMDTNGSATLEQIPAPWADSIDSPHRDSYAFTSSWKARKKESSSAPKPDKYNWRKQLEKQVACYDRASRLQATMIKHALQTKQRLDTLREKAS